jgi:hypothetical protein
VVRSATNTSSANVAPAGEPWERPDPDPLAESCVPCVPAEAGAAWAPAVFGVSEGLAEPGEPAAAVVSGVAGVSGVVGVVITSPGW